MQPQRIKTMNLREVAVEATGISAANKTMAIGAGVGATGWWAQVNWLGLTGVLVAVIGLFANLYFQHRRDKREKEMHQAQLAALKDRCEL